ncbi:MAG: hypothetical protein HQL89_09690 [Magnetococcales bacterium]|nr:hypothetical protein [Magnetococcales bacterium]
MQQRCIESHEWYLKKRTWPSRISKSLRLFAWFLVSVGGITPLLASMNTPEHAAFLNQLGYIF